MNKLSWKQVHLTTLVQPTAEGIETWTPVLNYSFGIIALQGSENILSDEPLKKKFWFINDFKSNPSASWLQKFLLKSINAY
jgi:hypothetical protein